MENCNQRRSTAHSLLCRALIILAALLVFNDRLRARYCSYLLQAWLKTSAKPVWLQQAGR